MLYEQVLQARHINRQYTTCYKLSNFEHIAVCMHCIYNSMIKIRYYNLCEKFRTMFISGNIEYPQRSGKNNKSKFFFNSGKAYLWFFFKFLGKKFTRISEGSRLDMF